MITYNNIHKKSKTKLKSTQFVQNLKRTKHSKLVLTMEQAA